MPNQKKINQLKLISDTISKKPNFILIKFQKTTHQAFESLRKDLKKTKTNLKVIKNTLFEKAINFLSQKNIALRQIKKNFFPLKEPSALITFDNDWSQGLKSVFDFINKNKTVSFKFGIIDNSAYSSDDLERIANLPGKNELLGKIIFSAKSPSQRLIYGLKYNISRLVYILKEKSKVKN